MSSFTGTGILPRRAQKSAKEATSCFQRQKVCTWNFKTHNMIALEKNAPAEKKELAHSGNVLAYLTEAFKIRSSKTSS